MDRFRIGLYRLVILLASSFLSGAALASPGLDQAEPIAAYLNGVFPSTAPGASVGTDGGYTQRNYFPGVEFVEPLRIIEHPLATN